MATGCRLWIFAYMAVSPTNVMSIGQFDQPHALETSLNNDRLLQSSTAITTKYWYQRYIVTVWGKFEDGFVDFLHVRLRVFWPKQKRLFLLSLSS